jgi:hypothetical protein
METEDQIGEFNPYQAPNTQDVIVKAKGGSTKGIDLTTESPFLTIWTRPRATMRGIVDTNPYLHVIPLAMVGGIMQTFARSVQRNAGDTLSLPAILALAVLVGPIGGLIGLFAGGWFMRTTARWLGGRATPYESRAAIAWSTVPVLVTLPVFVAQIALFGRELFTRETPTIDSNPAFRILLMASGLLEVIMGIWSFVVLLKGTAEVQGFSAWKALMSLILIGLVIIVPIALLVILALAFR